MTERESLTYTDDLGNTYTVIEPDDYEDEYFEYEDEYDMEVN